MVIAAAYSKKGRTLFINLDEFSGIEHIMMSDGCSNLSDVFYMFKQAGEHFTQQIRECIKANEYLTIYRLWYVLMIYRMLMTGL